MGTEARFTAGHRLGEIAQQLFGDAAYTIGHRTTTFETRFEAAGTQVFVDVLLPAQTPAKLPQRWGIVEVKSTTSVKDVHLEDAAI